MKTHLPRHFPLWGRKGWDGGEGGGAHILDRLVGLGRVCSSMYVIRHTWQSIIVHMIHPLLYQSPEKLLYVRTRRAAFVSKDSFRRWKPSAERVRISLVPYLNGTCRLPQQCITVSLYAQEWPERQSLVHPLRRLANTVAQEAKKFPCRGLLLDGELRTATAPSTPPQVHF